MWTLALYSNTTGGNGNTASGADALTANHRSPPDDLPDAHGQ